MKEIVVLAGSLGLLLFIFWVVIVLLELIRGQKKEDVCVDATEEVDESDDVLPAIIIAGVEMYRDGAPGKKARTKRVVWKPKEEKLSLWRTSGRYK